MKSEKYFAYDVLDIPEDIKNMTPEELDAEIARLEAEAAKEKQRILAEKKRSTQIPKAV